jgi:Tfp pilus assembly protein PilF
LGLGVAWWWSDRASRGGETGTGRAEAVDPRLTYPTPYRNVHPDVKYVGDRACARCHRKLFESCSGHPMGQAMAPLATATPIEKYRVPSNPFMATGLHYGVERRGNRVFHREWVEDPNGRKLAQVEAEVQFACGSGARAQSYLVNRDGYLFQSPITWFSHGERWDLSPSYETRNLHFGRAVAPPCLFCHCTNVEHVPDTLNRYRPPIFRGFVIGCERCHGPGELHVRRRTAGKVVTGLDDTIVNPARLEHSLREAVCQQCHLQGEQRVVARGRSDFDYRPGLPLHLFLMDFVDGRDRGAESKFVSSVEQMRVSRCYRASRGPKKLGCISCHDPHRFPAPDEKVAYYRQRCLNCHTEKSCSLPPAVRRRQSKADSCIACHMPRGKSEVNHTSITDHRIPRRPERSTRAEPAVRPTPGPSDLIPFHRDLIDERDEEVARNLGLAVLAMLDRGPPQPVARQYAAKALPLLERALRRDGDDTPVAQARADALWCLGRRQEALAAYEKVLARKPRLETALHRAGDLALALNRPKEARAFLERAVRVNPWRWQYHHGLAVASFRLGEWHRGVRECRQSLRLEISNPASRSLLVQCYLCLGQEEKARAEFEVLWQLTAKDRRQDLRRWFEQQQRRLPPQGG